MNRHVCRSVETHLPLRRDQHRQPLQLRRHQTPGVRKLCPSREPFCAHTIPLVLIALFQFRRSMVSFGPSRDRTSCAITSVPATVGVVPTAFVRKKLIPTNCRHPVRSRRPIDDLRMRPCSSGVRSRREVPLPIGKACAVGTDPLPITNRPAVTSPAHQPTSPASRHGPISSQ